MRRPKDHAAATDPVLRRLLGAARRMAVGVTGRAIWQVIGYKSAATGNETAVAEVFPGIGIYARPPSGGRAEAIVLNVGGADHPVVVALRDEATRRIAADVAEDETALYNSTAVVHVKADGTIEARSIGGSAAALATKSDIDALKAWAASHIHPDPSSGFTGAPTASPPTAAGTQKFKAE